MVKKAKKTTLEDLEIGKHVEIFGTFTGEVKFVGMTHFATGPVVGIELHTPVGQHSGSIDGQEYFPCGENRGFFCTNLGHLKVIPSPEELRAKKEAAAAKKKASDELKAKKAEKKARMAAKKAEKEALAKAKEERKIMRDQLAKAYTGETHVSSLLSIDDGSTTTTIPIHVGDALIFRCSVVSGEVQLTAPINPSVLLHDVSYVHPPNVGTNGLVERGLRFVACGKGSVRLEVASANGGEGSSEVIPFSCSATVKVVQKGGRLTG